MARLQMRYLEQTKVRLPPISATASSAQQTLYVVGVFLNRIGTGRTTIFDAIHEKRLRAKKYGRRTLILKEDAEEFLKSLPDVDRR